MILKNKNIFVTGAGKGIGLDTVKMAVKEGAFVYALTRSKTNMQELKKIKNSKFYFGNVADSKIIKKIFIDSLKHKRPIAGLVNNAGQRQRMQFKSITSKEINKIFKINFFSIFNLMQLYSKYLSSKKISASIVNVGSIAGHLGFSELSGYASTKAALTGLTKSFAVEMAKNNIRANIVNPGFTKTSFFEKFKKRRKLYNWTLSRIPMKRWGNSSEIAHLICFLLSDKSSYINGESINIDGGWVNS